MDYSFVDEVPHRKTDGWSYAYSKSKPGPDVLMMQFAEDWNHCDTAELLRPAKIRSIFI